MLTQLPLGKDSKHAPLQNISTFPSTNCTFPWQDSHSLWWFRLINPLLHHSAISLFFHVPSFCWSNTKRLLKFVRKTDFWLHVLQGTVHLYQSAWLFWLLLYKSHSGFVLTHVTAVVTVQTPIILKTSTQLAWIIHPHQAKTPLKVSWRIPCTKNCRIS